MDLNSELGTMTILQGVLAGAGLVAALMTLMWRLFVHYDAKNETRFEKNAERIEKLDAKNEQAHAAITENIKAVDARAEARAEAQRAALTENIKAVEARAEAQRTALDAQRTALDAIARDVSFLAGRQAERDRAHQ